MKTIGNIVWVLTGGWVTALMWAIGGIACYITIVGIPFGRQCFKMASLTFTPFGLHVSYGGGAPSILVNAIWVVFAGFWIACAYALNGAVWCVTVVGAPFGVQLFKMAKLALFPFGAQVNRW